MDTTLRPTTAGGTGGTLGARTSASSRLAPTRAPERVDDTASTAGPSSPTSAPLRTNGGAAKLSGGLQDQVARAQQALDYLDRVATQLEALKGELTARLASSRTTAPRPQLDAQVRQLAQTLSARRKSGGGSVDSNLNYSTQPAMQRFRIRGMDLDSVRKSAPTSISFSVGGAGGPQMAVNIEPDQSNQEVARALDRALAPMGVHASLDENGELVFSTPESNWSAVKDSIAVSGRGRVTTDEVPPSLVPQQWNVGGNGSDGGTAVGNPDALRQSLREVVQALERVHRSQSAASSSLAAASTQVSEAETPPPDVELAAGDFSKAAASTDYDSLVALTSALVGVSRDRVLALLGLR